MTEQLDQRAAPRHQQRMLIYKIFRGPEWQALQSDGSTLGAPVDREDGYIHLSTAEQAPETAAKFFAGIEGLWLIAVETDGLDNLHWEPSRGGALFPHLFRPLRMDDVIWAKPLPVVDNEHAFPEAMV